MGSWWPSGTFFAPPPAPILLDSLPPGRRRTSTHAGRRVRPERRNPHAIATLRIVVARLLRRQLPHCPFCGSSPDGASASNSTWRRLSTAMQSPVPCGLQIHSRVHQADLSLLRTSRHWHNNRGKRPQIAATICLRAAEAPSRSKISPTHPLALRPSNESFRRCRMPLTDAAGHFEVFTFITQ